MKPVSKFHQIKANLLWRLKYDIYAPFGISDISLPCTRVNERSKSWSDPYVTLIEQPMIAIVTMAAHTVGL